MEQGKLSQGECLQRLQELLQKAPKLRSREASRALDRCRKALSRPGGQWSGEEWAALEKELLQRVLKIDATAFLYDAGVPLSGDGREGPVPLRPMTKRIGCWICWMLLQGKAWYPGRRDGGP